VVAFPEVRAQIALVAQGIERRFPNALEFVRRRSSQCISAGHKGVRHSPTFVTVR